MGVGGKVAGEITRSNAGNGNAATGKDGVQVVGSKALVMVEETSDDGFVFVAHKRAGGVEEHPSHADELRSSA